MKATTLGRSSYDADRHRVTEVTRLRPSSHGAVILEFSYVRSDGEAYQDRIWLSEAMVAKLLATLA